MILDRVSYSRLVDNLNDGLYIVDRDRIIQYWNKAAERISGHTAVDLIGKPCSDNVLTHVDGDGNSLCIGMCPLLMTITDGEAPGRGGFFKNKNRPKDPLLFF